MEETILPVVVPSAEYRSDLLLSSPKDRARFQLGDTGVLKDEAGAVVWLVSDEEIGSFVALFGYAEGVAQIADALTVRFAQEPTLYQDEGGVKVEWGKRFEAWARLAQSLRTNATKTVGANPGAPLLQTSLGPDLRRVRP